VTEATGRAGSATCPSACLTPRERDVLRLLADGKTDREIARDLGIRHRTATTHVGRLLAKLGLPSRAALAAWAVRHGVA
jgi:DNA-binding CsgD family transcriptional regulator